MKMLSKLNVYGSEPGPSKSNFWSLKKEPDIHAETIDKCAQDSAETLHPNDF